MTSTSIAPRARRRARHRSRTCVPRPRPVVTRGIPRVLLRRVRVALRCPGGIATAVPARPLRDPGRISLRRGPGSNRLRRCFAGTRNKRRKPARVAAPRRAVDAMACTILSPWRVARSRGTAALAQHRCCHLQLQRDQLPDSRSADRLLSSVHTERAQRTARAQRSHPTALARARHGRRPAPGTQEQAAQPAQRPRAQARARHRQCARVLRRVAQPDHAARRGRTRRAGREAGAATRPAGPARPPYPPLRPADHSPALRVDPRSSTNSHPRQRGALLRPWRASSRIRSRCRALQASARYRLVSP